MLEFCESSLFLVNFGKNRFSCVRIPSPGSYPFTCLDEALKLEGTGFRGRPALFREMGCAGEFVSGSNQRVNFRLSRPLLLGV
jgi:hypothetical protein